MDSARKKMRTCECGRIFPRSSYYRHIKLCKQFNKNSTKKSPENFLCREENCTFSSKFQEDFVIHLKEKHNICCEVEMKDFQDYAEFEKWKESMEKSTKSGFYCETTCKTLSGSKKYFRCSRSGYYKSVNTGKRSVKSQGLQKIGHNCTATIKVQICKDTSTVKAKVCLTHYGHDNQLAHTRLSKNDKMLIAKQLSMGIESSQIIRNMFKMFPTKLERQHLTTKRDIKNIAKAFGIDKVEKHSEDYFLYKNQGKHHLRKKGDCQISQQPDSLSTPELPSSPMQDLPATNTNTSNSNVLCTNIVPHKNEDLNTLRSEIVSKLMKLSLSVEQCNDRNLLLAARNHIDWASSVLKL